MEKINNTISKTNGFSNSEMYNKSRKSDIESVGFWTVDFELIKGKTTFSKVPNGTIASVYSWYDNSATYFEKVDGKWYELSEERTEAIQDELRKKGRKMVEAAKQEMETKSTIKKNEIFVNAKNLVNAVIDWKNSEMGQKRIAERMDLDAIADNNIDEHTYVYAIYDGNRNTIDFNITFDGVDTSTNPEYADALDNCFSYPVEAYLDADEIANELAIWAIDMADDPRVVYTGLQLRSDLGDIYEVMQIYREFHHNEWEWCAELRDVNSDQLVECIGGELQWEDAEEFVNWENRVEEVCEDTQEERAAALEWLVERFIEDDNYARQLIDDVDSGKATLDELLLVVKCGLIARYERVTGKSLIDGEPYMAILTLDLLNTRCEQLYDGVGLCDVQPLIDEFGAKRWPVYVGIANEKKNAMGLDW